MKQNKLRTSSKYLNLYGDKRMTEKTDHYRISNPSLSSLPTLTSLLLILPRNSIFDAKKRVGFPADPPTMYLLSCIYYQMLHKTYSFQLALLFNIFNATFGVI